jgi:hypothetical protein
MTISDGDMTIGDLMDWLEGYPRDAEVLIKSPDGRELTWVGGFTYKAGEPGEIHIANTGRPVLMNGPNRSLGDNVNPPPPDGPRPVPYGPPRPRSSRR